MFEEYYEMGVKYAFLKAAGLGGAAKKIFGLASKPGKLSPKSLSKGVAGLERRIPGALKNFSPKAPRAHTGVRV